jgi:hypothetical protein
MGSKLNFIIDQGATFSIVVDLKDTNDEPLIVDGYIANAALRKAYGASNSVIFTANIANGSLTLSLTANQTANIVAGRYVYDAKLTDSLGIISRPLEGVVTVTPGVT